MNERLTKKTDRNDYYIPVKKGMLMAGYVDKLGQLEDIEEELDIDLVTLFKALKDGIWVKRISDDKMINIPCYLGLDGRKEIQLFETPYGLYHHLENYGKTWALTREELEK